VVAIQTAGDGGPVIKVHPEASEQWRVEHLPPSVSPSWDEAVMVFQVGAFASAVVQCGRTLEAAFDARKVTGGNLSARVRNAQATGLITQEFTGAMDFARLIRNIGAHAGQEVQREPAEGAMRFTQQALRLLFEVPSELALLVGPPPDLLGEEEDEGSSS
jgi:Domain of unknown function (DUF4145)